MRVAPITTRKHIVQFSPTNVATGAQTNVLLAVANQNPDQDQADEVEVGSIVKAVYVELWMSSDDAQQGSQIVAVMKRPNGVGVGAGLLTLHTFTNKNNMFRLNLFASGNVGVTTTPNGT